MGVEVAGEEGSMTEDPIGAKDGAGLSVSAIFVSESPVEAGTSGVGETENSVGSSVRLVAAISEQALYVLCWISICELGDSECDKRRSKLQTEGF